MCLMCVCLLCVCVCVYICLCDCVSACLSACVRVLVCERAGADAARATLARGVSVAWLRARSAAALSDVGARLLLRVSSSQVCVLRVIVYVFVCV